MNAATPFQPAQPAPWSLAGIVMSGYVETLRSRGLLVRVRSRVSPATRALLDRPPLAICSFDGTALDELLVALQDIAGDEVIRQVAAETCRNCLRPVLRPVLHGTLSLFGKTPRALFADLNSIMIPIIHRLRFDYDALEDTFGLLSIVFPTETRAATFVSWEGIARFAIEFAGRVPDVRGHEAVLGNRQVFIPVRWSRR
jgi:hypothetical protein